MHRDNLGRSHPPEPLWPKTLLGVCLHGKVMAMTMRMCARMKIMVFTTWQWGWGWQCRQCRSNLEWIYIGPVLLLLATNMFFLVSIFTVVGIIIIIIPPPCIKASLLLTIKVVTKLRATGERGEPADHQNWKAAKALLVTIMIINEDDNDGDHRNDAMTLIILLVLGDHPTAGHHLHHHHPGAERRLHHLPYPLCTPQGRPSLHSGHLLIAMMIIIIVVVVSMMIAKADTWSQHQGFTVTLPYCFLNTEVRSILRHHWLRLSQIPSYYPQSLTMLTLVWEECSICKFMTNTILLDIDTVENPSIDINRKRFLQPRHKGVWQKTKSIPPSSLQGKCLLKHYQYYLPVFSF